MMKHRINVEFRPFKGGERTAHGWTAKTDSKCDIIVDSNDPLLSQVGTVFHEIGHWLFWTILQSTDEGRAHQFCDAMDRAARRAFKKYLEV